MLIFLAHDTSEFKLTTTIALLCEKYVEELISGKIHRSTCRSTTE